MSTMTPYAAAKIVNNELELRGIRKTIPPQMIYTYVNKNYIDSVLVDGKKRITKESLETWFATYVAKYETTTNTEEVDENQLVLFSE